MVNIVNDQLSRSFITERQARVARHQAARVALVPDTGLSVTGRTATATRYLLAGIRLAWG
jgi:thiosulfate dehydrogenase [quinone] large subunit